MKRIVIFASGTGGNALNIVKYFGSHHNIEVAACFCNNPKALVIEKMHKAGIPTLVFNKAQASNEKVFLKYLSFFNPDLIVLAGYLWLIPEFLINKYPRKIINIHPSLLPLYGGKGMFGDMVHSKVLESSDTKSGITIHYIDAFFDKGEIIKQVALDLEPNESIETLRSKIHELEFAHLPETIEEILR